MYIDDLLDLVSYKTPRKLSPDVSDEELADFVRQLASLEAITPKFDVHNIHVVLHPTLVQPAQPNPVVEERNRNLTERRDDLLNMATAAPINPPYDLVWLERRYSDTQRLGYLVTYDAAKLLYNVTLVFETGNNESAAITNCFQILPQTPDDMMFGGFTYREDQSVKADEMQKVMKESAIVVRTFIQLKNWSSDEIPTVTLSALGGLGAKLGRRMVGTKGSGKSPVPVKKPKSSPSIIRFEPFLKKIRGCSIPRAQRKSRGIQSEETIVAGGWRNYTIQAPLFGHKPVLGKTYGRLWHKPFKRGNPNLGVKAPSGIFVIGNVHKPPTPAPAAVAAAAVSKKKKRGKKWKAAS